MDASRQAEVFTFLSEPASWPAKPERVDIIETHGARVFLAGNDVLKIKRAVHLPYLDFSTLAARRHFCEREIELNSRGAPGIYRDAIPITRDASGALHIGGDGEPVEWAVRMQRFSQHDVLKAAIHREPPSLSLTSQLADAVFAYHDAAPVAPPQSENIAGVTQGVLASLARFEGLMQSSTLKDLERLFAAYIQTTAELRHARAEHNRIRRCHGDLHTGNIVLWQGKPVLFDALEFDEQLATVDTLYDLAFLLMDLDRQGARETANGVLNRYLWRTRDLLDVEGLKLMPLYLGLRATIRAMVTFERIKSSTEQSAILQEQARETLALALRDLAPPPPRLIAVGGLSGTGKTTLARALAPAIGAVPGALHIRSDMERKALAGVEPEVRLPSSAYTPASSEAVYMRVLARAHAALAAGHAAVVDAVFARPDERAAIEDLARTLGVPFTGIWLEGAPATLTARVTARTGDASDATADVVARQLTYDTGAIGWHKVDASQSAEATRAAAQRLL